MYANRKRLDVLKDIFLFFAAPVIALAYLVLFPYYAAGMVRRAWAAKHKAPANP